MISNLWSHSSEGKGKTLWSHRKDFVAWNNECVNITCRWIYMYTSSCITMVTFL